MILLRLPLLLCIIPLTVLAAVLTPVNRRLYVLAAGGLAAVTAACGLRGLFLTALSVSAGWLCLRLQKTGQQDHRAAAFWLTGGIAVQAVLLMFGRTLSSPAQRFPLLFCVMQSIGCMTARYAGRLAPQPLGAYVCYQLTLPRLIGGPVLSVPQAQETAAGCERSARRAGEGALHFTAGLFQLSLLAAPLFTMHRQMTESHAAESSADVWLLLIVFYLGAYYAVRGAAEMCRGIAALTGYALAPQSDTPLRAHTPSGFCRRWYRSAADWFRKILLRDESSADNTAYFARLLPMLCGIGLLLGRGWATGVFWGAYMSLVLMVERVLRRRGIHAAKGVSRFLTAVLILCGCSLLQATSVSESFGTMSDLFGRNGILPSGKAVYSFRNHWLPLLAGAAGLLPLRDALGALLRKHAWLRGIAYILIPAAEAAVLLICVTGLLSGYLRG
ncbi:MAG: hypothetical protein J6Z45_06110 [Oscillospiraceae bacterium]|nr:hypothetical protein [Oscillospiraceae bacterium]